MKPLKRLIANSIVSAALSISIFIAANECVKLKGAYAEGPYFRTCRTFSTTPIYKSNCQSPDAGECKGQGSETVTTGNQCSFSFNPFATCPPYAGYSTQTTTYSDCVFHDIGIGQSICTPGDTYKNPTSISVPNSATCSL